MLVRTDRDLESGQNPAVRASYGEKKHASDFLIEILFQRRMHAKGRSRRIATEQMSKTTNFFALSYRSLHAFAI